MYSHAAAYRRISKPFEAVSRPERTLSRLRRGESARVISVDGGQGMRTKLQNLGIYEGITIKVAQNHGYGPVLIELEGTRLMLGRKMAERLWVSDSTTAVETGSEKGAFQKSEFGPGYSDRQTEGGSNETTE